MAGHRQIYTALQVEQLLLVFQNTWYPDDDTYAALTEATQLENGSKTGGAEKGSAEMSKVVFHNTMVILIWSWLFKFSQVLDSLPGDLYSRPGDLYDGQHGFGGLHPGGPGYVVEQMPHNQYIGGLHLGGPGNGIGGFHPGDAIDLPRPFMDAEVEPEKGTLCLFPMQPGDLNHG